MTTQEFLEKYRGKYYLISPYHKNKKKLPFIICGHSYYEDYPILCYTVEYRGWTKYDVSGNYNIKTLLDFIENGVIKRINHENHGKRN